MVLPKYVQTEWYGEGKAILEFRRDRDLNDEDDEDTRVPVKSTGKITCFMSSLFISEYEERVQAKLTTAPSGAADISVTSIGDSVPVDVNNYACPPDVPLEIWQSWLEHWENWKEIYVPLSWIQKNRSLCNNSHVEWHDSYIQEYPWVIPVIRDGLDENLLPSDSKSLAQVVAKEQSQEKNNTKKSQEMSDVSWEKSDSKDTFQGETGIEDKYKELPDIEDKLQEELCTKNKSEKETCTENKSLEETGTERKVQEPTGTENLSQVETGSETMSQEKAGPESESSKNDSEEKSQVITSEDSSQEKTVTEKFHECNEKKSNEDPEAKKELDKLYSEFSNARYWIHLRSFLQNNGVDPSENLVRFFQEQGQVDFCRTSIKSDDSIHDLTLASAEEMCTDKYINTVEDGLELQSGDDGEIIVTISGNNGMGNESAVCEKSGTKRRKEDREDACMEEVEVGKGSPMHSKRPRHEGNHIDHSVLNGHDNEDLETTDDEKSDEIEDCPSSKLLDGAKTKKSSKQKRKKKILQNSKSHAGVGWLMSYIGKDQDHCLSGETNTNTSPNQGNIFSVASNQVSQETVVGQCELRSTLGNLPSADYQFKADELNLKEDTKKLSKCFDSQSGTVISKFSEEIDEATVCKEMCNGNTDDCNISEKEYNSDDRESGENGTTEESYDADDGESEYEGNEEILDNNNATEKKVTVAVSQSKPWYLHPYSSLKDFLFVVASHVLNLFIPSLSIFMGSSWSVSKTSWSFLASFRRMFGFRKSKTIKKPSKKLCQVKLEKWLQKVSSTNVCLRESEPFSRFHTYEDTRGMPTLYQSLEMVSQDDGTSFVVVNTLDLQNHSVFDCSQAAEEDNWENCHIVFDDDGNPVCMPEGIENNGEDSDFYDKERKIWKGIIADYRFVSYKNEKEIPPLDLPEHLHKYWAQRHRLFLRYDEGIKLDEESWYSVTPEMIAAHHAYRCKCDVVVDAFCGSGGNAIQLASTCKSVIAIDIDPDKIELARHNAAIYGVQDNIKFIVGDFYKLAPTLNADVVLLSPPWGGTEYVQQKVYDVKKLGGAMDCEELIKTARLISENIALYLPRSSNLCQIIELAGLGGKLDLEYNYMNKKIKAVTAYFGDLVHY